MAVQARRAEWPTPAPNFYVSMFQGGDKGKESKWIVNDPRINGKGSSQRDRRVWPSVIGIDVKGEMRKELKVLFLNAQSIRSKVDEFEAQLEVGRYDIVGITETWLQEGRAWELNIQGYTSYSQVVKSHLFIQHI